VGVTGAAGDLQTLFGGFVASPWEPITWHLGFLLVTALIVAGGVRGGIERCSKVLMPALFVMVALMAVRSLTLPGASAGVEFLFKPDFSLIDGSALLAAMGQAFFSLSLGMGIIITYGSYMKRTDSIPRTGLQVMLADTSFAIIAGLAIMPAVFAFGIEPGQGPGLVFVTVPGILMQLPLGALFATIFFAILAVAALTSAISLLEVMTAFMTEEFRLHRRAGVAVSFAIVAVLGVLASLSMNPTLKLDLFGKNAFDLMDYVSSNILLPTGGLLIVLFAGWKLAPADLRDELTAGGGMRPWLYRTTRFLLRYIVPVGILAIFLSNL
jgi:NSS family neurotransmitter:Na+ symporter